MTLKKLYKSYNLYKSTGVLYGLYNHLKLYTILIEFTQFK